MDRDDSGNGQVSTFDWESARQRIAVTDRALEGLDETTPEAMRQIWDRRAARLAEVPSEEDKGEQITLVLVQLGRELYGLEARHVFAIRSAEQITPVPRVPNWVAGVVNMRGRVLSVVDLQLFFGLPAARGDGSSNATRDSASSTDSPSELAERTSELVVVEGSDMEVALLVDDVLTVEMLPASHIQDVNDTVRGLRHEYVRGVVEYSDGETQANENGSMVVVLDLPTLLADEQLIVHEEI